MSKKWMLPKTLMLCLAVFALAMPGAMAKKNTVVEYRQGGNPIIVRKPPKVRHPHVAHPRRVVIREQVVRVRRPVQMIVSVPRHGPATFTPPYSGPGWAVAKRPGNANWVRDAPNHKGRIIEKIRQGARFRVVGQAPDSFGTIYYHVVLPDLKVGWLDHVCVKFVR